MNGRLRKVSIALFVFALAAAMVAPAAMAKKGDPKKGGKKAMGEVVSFDASTGSLVVTLTDGSSVSATVSPDVKVKLEHRGSHSRGKGHGNPSSGSLADVVAGAKILKMKERDGLVEKLRLRPAAAPVTEEPLEPAP